MKVVSVEGIVVKGTLYKESSKILNVFTREYGIIGVLSKGCRKLKSPNRLISDNFAYGVFHISYKENGLSTLISGDVKNYFTNIKSDIKLISYMTYLVKFASNVFNESDNENIYDLLISALNKLEEGLDPKVISNILELKYLEYLGISLNTDSCTVCASRSVITFSHSKGGFVCNKCKKDEAIIDPKVLKMLRMYKYVDISKISKIDISTDVVMQIDNILESYIKDYSGINIKSRELLKNLE